MWFYVALLILGLAGGGIGAWKIQGWRQGAMDKERLEAAAEVAKLNRISIDKASEGHEKDKGQIRVKYKVITNEVSHVVKTPFYVTSELCFDGAGLQILTKATRPASAASQPTGALPGPKPPG